MDVTASTHLMIGDYQALKAAHLSHDEEKYNDNKDIDYELKKYNTHNKYIDDMDAWKDENYEEPIRKFNARQKNKSRRFDDYADYKKRQEQKGSRNQDVEISPNRLMIMNFADMASNENMKRFFTSKKRKDRRMTEEQYYKMVAAGMDLAVERFNEHFEHLQITESFTHVNEGSPHTHCDVWAIGTDKFGKPFVDINDGLYAHYGKTRTVEKEKKDGTVEEKEVRMTHRALWETFRLDIDENIIHTSMMDAIESHYGSKVNGINFHRKESDVVGVKHDVWKDAAKKATQTERRKLERKEDSLSNKETSLKAKEEILNEKDNDLQEREQILTNREAMLDERVDEIQEWYDSINKREQSLNVREERIKKHEDITVSTVASVLESRNDNMSKFADNVRNNGMDVLEKVDTEQLGNALSITLMSANSGKLRIKDPMNPSEVHKNVVQQEHENDELAR